MKNLKSNEIELRGSWELVDGSNTADDVSNQIEMLISTHLVEIDEDESGWFKLYKDPDDNSFWELSYPESELHGGGAPLLKRLTLLMRWICNPARAKSKAANSR